MLQTTTMSNSTSLSEEATVSSGSRAHDLYSLNPLFMPISTNNLDQHKAKKKRNQPGNPDPDAEVIALSPKTLMATNRFVCEICNKGFQRDQNLQLHRRGHNLPWKLRQKNSKEVVKKVYVCPEPTCVHNHPSRALGDLTGIKKHFCRKHGEKLWKCDKCSKKYAVMSDWKAHTKTCGTREYRCDCGTLFSRKDSFITHRAFCDALAEETARLSAAAAAAAAVVPNTTTISPPHHSSPPNIFPFSWHQLENPNPNSSPCSLHANPGGTIIPTLFPQHLTTSTTATAQPYLSATALLQKASSMGAMATTATAGYAGLVGHMGVGDLLSTWKNRDRLTRDFLGGVALSDEGAEELLLSGLALDFVSSSPCENDPTTTTTTRVGFPSQTWGNC